MAYAHSETANHGTSAASTTVTLSGAPADNSLLFALVCSVAGVTGAPAGWTQIHDVNDVTSEHISVYYKIASGEGTTFVFTGTSEVTAIMSVFTGNAITSPQDAEGGAKNTGSVTTICAPSITTVGDNDLLVFAGFSNNGSSTITPPSGMTEPTNGELARAVKTLEVAYLLDAGAAGSTGDKSASLSGTSTQGSVGFLVAFKILSTVSLAHQIVWMGL